MPNVGVVSLSPRVILLFRNSCTLTSEIQIRELPSVFQIFLATVSTPYTY
nr:MAG TPA: hypothetical protein [Caudoviricetes sp.]